MGLPPQLETDIDALKKEGYDIKAIRDPPENARIYIVIENYPLPDGWVNGDKKVTRLLIISDTSYPNSKLDMFWTEAGVLLSSGKVPQSGDLIEPYMGTQWRRFSWHCQKWNPAIDNLITYLDTINSRLRQKT